MNQEYQHSEIIEAYLRNELSEEKKADFEQLTRQDPLLENELTLQKEIMVNLQNYRKLQLKARLNQIDVSHAPSWSGAGSAGMWIAGLLVVGLLGWIGYLTLQPASLPQPVAQVSAAPVQEPVAGNILETPMPENKPAGAVTQKDIVRVKPTPASNRVRSRQPDITETGHTATEHEINPHFREETPEKPEGTDETASEKIIAHGNTVSSANRLKVVDNTNERLKLHYCYQNGRISLLGFDKPYTFLDMPAESVTYLHYEGSFYKLNVQHSTPVPIQTVLVTDPAVIDTLRGMLTGRK